MCQLVTIGIPKSVDPIATEFGGPRDGLAVTPSNNLYVASIFPKTDIPLDVTNGSCSCGLVGGSHGARSGDVASQRRRYEKLGWSRAKIDRALQASAAARSRDHSSVDARRFREGVLALLERMPSIRMFVHMYRGDFATEVVVSKGEMHLTRSEYEAMQGAIPEDSLVEIGG